MESPISIDSVQVMGTRLQVAHFAPPASAAGTPLVGTAQQVNDLPPWHDTVAASIVTPPHELAWLDGLERNDLERETLSRVEELAQLDAAKFGLLCAELHRHGVSRTWTERTLRPAINQARPSQVQPAIWRDFVAVASSLGYTFRLNELDDSLEVNGHRMTDVSEATLLSLLHEQGLGNAEVARRAFLHAGSENRYHPIRDYLDGLVWDGQDHIARLARYFADDHEPITHTDGSERTVFHSVMRRWLIGAVGRVCDPCNVQNFMPILDGPQDVGKSSFVRWLCPLPGFAVEKSIEPGNKDYDALLTTTWVWEVPELGALMRKADREALKSFLTTQQVTYRPPYGRYAITKPALASFIGTVNFEGALLSDPTGNRRFFPINLTGIDRAYSKGIDVHQLWAQACVLYRQGEPWQLSDEERAAHATITMQYEVEDVLAGYIYQWFEVTPTNDEIFAHTTTIIDRLRTFAGVREGDKQLAMNLSRSLHSMGLTRIKRMVNGVRGWGYCGIAPNRRGLAG